MFYKFYAEIGLLKVEVVQLTDATAEVHFNQKIKLNSIFFRFILSNVKKGIAISYSDLKVLYKPSPSSFMSKD